MTAILPLGRAAKAVAALLLVACAAGCASVVDNMPTGLGGLPEGVPQRSAAPAAYPAVHDIPPARQENALNEVQSKRLREELKNVRNRVATPDATGSADQAGSARRP